MLPATIVSKEDELHQISMLNQQNLKENLSAEAIKQEGFLSWKYSFDLLLQLHRLAPSIIVKDGEKVVGYALATLREAGAFHTDLQQLFQQLDQVLYKEKTLFSWPFYCMGQICVHNDYRGKGLVDVMYAKHREVYAQRFSLLVTEIATANPRSLHAHYKTGFRNMHTYTENDVEWNVVVWDWNS